MKHIKSKEALVCIAAGYSQLPLILKAKSLGYIVIAIDKNKKAPGFNFADFKICKSTHHVDSILKSLKKYKSKFTFRGVINRSAGPPVITASKISKYLNLPGMPILSSINLVNKDKMRSSFFKKKIVAPEFRIFKTKNFNEKNIINFPIVFKPGLSLVGKSGVSIVDSKKKILPAVKYAEKFTINNKILIEEYLEGPNLSLISFVNKGALYPITLLQEINEQKKNGSIVPKGFRTLKKKHHKWKSKAESIALEIISKYKIQQSPLMISFRRKNKKDLCVIEVHLDLGGDLLMEAFFSKAFTFDFLKLAIEMCTGSLKNPIKLKTKPTAIFYNDGAVHKCSYRILTAKSEELLDKKIAILKI